MPNWKVWLNIQLSSSPLSVTHNIKYQQIGKNIWYESHPKPEMKETIWKTESITVIGNARIYNEESLWEMIGKTSTSTSTLEIIAELYKLYGFETMLDYLDGDYAFVLMDYNIFGEEARLYVAKDAFGMFPLYKMESPDTSYKKVSFVRNHTSEFVENTSIAEMKASPLYIEIPCSPNSRPYSNIYGFSSENIRIENTHVESVPNGTYQVFTHSYKVSANWKTDGNTTFIYQLPFQSTYGWKKYEFRPPNYQNRLEEQIRIAIQKRVEWMTHRQVNRESVGVLKLSFGGSMNNGLLKFHSLDAFMDIPVIEIRMHLFPSFDDLSKLDSEAEAESKTMNKESNVMVYLETKYPTVLQEIKSKIDSNDPGIIRAHFIPAIVAKYMVENYPEVKVIFMGEAFTYEYLEMNMFERRKWRKNVYFLEKVRAWTEIFMACGLEIYMPFLDRMLVQTPDNYSRV